MPQVGTLVPGYEPAGVALQPIVHALGHVEEGVVGRQDVPAGVQAHSTAERHQRAQYLGHAPAIRGRVDVHDAEAAQGLRQRLDLPK
jgi:hypothetical protein